MSSQLPDTLYGLPIIDVKGLPSVAGVIEFGHPITCNCPDCEKYWEDMYWNIMNSGLTLGEKADEEAL